MTKNEFNPTGFARAITIRAIRAFAGGMLGAIGTASIGITQVDWLGATSVGATAAVVAILMTLAWELPETHT